MRIFRRLIFKIIGIIKVKYACSSERMRVSLAHTDLIPSVLGLIYACLFFREHMSVFPLALMARLLDTHDIILSLVILFASVYSR